MNAELQLFFNEALKVNLYFGMGIGFFFALNIWGLVWLWDMRMGRKQKTPFPELLPLDQIPDGSVGARTQEHAEHCRQGRPLS